MKLIAAACLIAGAVLLAATLLGATGVHTGVPQAKPAPGESYDAQLVTEARSLDAMRAAVEQSDALSEREQMDRLYAVVGARFVQGDTQHTPFTNWIMWSLGVLRSDIRTCGCPTTCSGTGSKQFAARHRICLSPSPAGTELPRGI